MEKDIIFHDGIGRALSAVLHLPEGKGPFPVVVMTHGFGSNKSKHFDMARKLAGSGIAAFRFDFFGCGDSDGKFERTTIRKMLEDLRFAVDTVASIHLIDPEKISLFGSSIGGLVSILQASSDSRIKAMVLKSPATELIKSMKVNEEIWKEKGFILYDTGKGGLKINYSFWEDAKKWDVYREAASVTCPTLIVHGEKDDVVPLSHSKRLFGVLKSEHKDLKVLEGTTHFYNPEEKLQLIRSAVDWFGRFL